MVRKDHSFKFRVCDRHIRHRNRSHRDVHHDAAFDCDIFDRTALECNVIDIRFAEGQIHKIGLHGFDFSNFRTII
ncbi:hypothetical protein D3C72_2075760 [compost metagenome]